MKVIVFEDDPDFAETLETILTCKGHEVHVFPDPSICPIYKDHEKQCPKNSPCADVLISDQRMPNITGLDFFKLQRKRGCKALDQNKVVLSGCVLDEKMKNDIDSLKCHYMIKPFKMAELLGWMDECSQRLKDKNL